MREIVACVGKVKEEWIEGELFPRVKYLLRFNQPPDFLAIHCGGNNNGAVKLRELRCQIKDSLGQLMAILPTAKLI
jgi:hypothetical protein